MSLQIHHIGIVAVSEEQIQNFARVLELKEIHRELLEKYHVTNVFFEAGNGGAKVQFMLAEKGTLKNFNGGKGGLHHIAFLADDIEQTQSRLKEEGVKFIANQTQAGVAGLLFNFVSPNIEGVNIEFVQEPVEGWPLKS